MRYALLSDIHSNWEALGEALDHLSKQRIDEYWVLGDSVGYGANPNECLGWVLEKAGVALLGNHEQAVVDPRLRDWFTGDARRAIEWTAGVLKPEHQQRIKSLNFLHIASSLTVAHGSPDRPEEYRYLFSFEDARPSFGAFKTPICFVGHTHVPSIFIESTESANYLPPGSYGLKRDERYILNPGSVGQPRDQDSRLAFGIFDDETWTFELVRLKYDNQKAAQKIREAGLPLFLAARLLV